MSLPGGRSAVYRKIDGFALVLWWSPEYGNRYGSDLLGGWVPIFLDYPTLAFGYGVDVDMRSSGDTALGCDGLAEVLAEDGDLVLGEPFLTRDDSCCFEVATQLGIGLDPTSHATNGTGDGGTGEIVLR